MPSATYFPHSHDIEVNNSTITTVSGNQTNYYNEENIGWRLLIEEIKGVGGFHDSRARSPHPKRHPGTFEAVFRRLSDWVKGEMLQEDYSEIQSVEEENIDWEPEDDPDFQAGGMSRVHRSIDSSQSTDGSDLRYSGFTGTVADLKTSIHLLCGLLGTGKSAIMQELSDCFAGRHVAATFFFSRRAPTRNSPQYLFLAIASCLGACSLDLGIAINKVVQRHPSILEAAIDVQFRELVSKPLQQISQKSWEELPKVIIIDGLHEIRGSDSQKTVLEIISEEAMKGSLADEGPHRTLRFLISTWPDPIIRDTFSQYCHIMTRTELKNDDSTSRDMTALFHDRFAEIVKRDQKIKSPGPFPWPPTEIVIDELVRRASGQFSYAIAVLKYIGQQYSSPDQQLQHVMRSPVGDPSVFSDIDILFTDVLSSNPDQDQQKQVLGTWFAMQEVASPQISTMEYLLSLPSGTVSTTLQGMHSVLNITDTNVELLHHSFCEFLMDSRRSGGYHIDIPMYHEQVARNCLRILRSVDLQSYYLQDRSGHPIAYVMCFWLQHVRRAARSGPLLQDIRHPDFQNKLGPILQHSVGIRHTIT